MKLHYYLIFLSLCLCFSACGTEDETLSEAVQVDSQVEIILQPHPVLPEKDNYEIGEHISYYLLIKNHNEVPIELPGLVFCNYQLAFASPNGMHLIAPDGQDLLLPYQQPTITHDDCPPIQVEAQGGVGNSIPISLWPRLRQPGQYRFWVELLDDLGKLHRSNEISFQLVDMPASVPLELVEFNLQSNKTTYTLKELLDSSIRFEVVFTNNSDQTLIFMENSSDSFSNLAYPVYQYTVIDELDRSLRQAGTEAPWGEPIYRKFTLEPGSSHQFKISLTRFPKMAQPGEYRVRLTYIVREEVIEYGIVMDEPMNWEEGVFTGVLESNEITITITE